MDDDERRTRGSRVSLPTRYDDDVNAKAQRMSYAEYREGELDATSKHEYLRGEVFAMTGGTPQHGALAMRVGAMLSRELGKRPCRVYSSDVRVRVEATEAHDRGQKASQYRQIPSLRAYLLVSQREPHLELQVRRADGGWLLLEAGPGQTLSIDVLELSLQVDEVYEDPLADAG